MIDLGRAISLALSILSLYGMLEGAFFVPATRWEERLIISVARIGLAGCVCLASGMLFRHEAEPASPLVGLFSTFIFVDAVWLRSFVRDFVDCGCVLHAAVLA